MDIIRDVLDNQLVEVDVSAQETPALAYEKWLSDRIITRIPGANHGE